MLRRRDVVLTKLRKRSYSTEQLADELKISQATVRKHIELLRKEGHNITYDRREKRYYTQEAVANMNKTEKKLKHFIAQWIGSTTQLRDESTINNIYRILGEGAAEVEEKTAQLILRYLIRHHSNEGNLTIDTISESLGLDKELVEKVLDRLVGERIIAKKEYGKLIFYCFEEERAGFIEAINKGYLTLSTSEIGELFTIRESTAPPDKPGLNTLAVYPSGKKKIYRWAPGTVRYFLIPQIFSAFISSFSRPSYEAVNGTRFSGHGFWEYMPRIIRYQQGAKQNTGVDKKKLGIIEPVITTPEDVLVQDMINEQSPDPYMYSQLGFEQTATPQLLQKATKTVERSKVRSLLAYHRPLYERIKTDGILGLEDDIQEMKSIYSKGRETKSTKDGSSFTMIRAEPSAWLTAAYLTMIGKVFEYTITYTKAIGLEEYVPRLEEYSGTFTQAAKELETRHPDETGISDKPLLPQQYEATDEPSWLANTLKLDVEELLGTSNKIRNGENFTVKGHYTLNLDQTKSLEKTGKSRKEARETLKALKGHETGNPAAITLTSKSTQSRGSGFQLYPGTRLFEATTKVRGTVRGDGKTLSLNLYDLKNQQKTTVVKKLKLQ